MDSFRRGAALLAVPPEIVQIPYEDSFLPGYYFRAAADAAPRATMILTTGYDGTAEELYFANGAAALERGYNVLAFDGPGQGTMLIDRGVPLRPDWENVITPVVDYLLTRPDVDPEQIVLTGLSLGGYLAPRAATAEHRLAACISDCGPYDVSDAIARRLPGFLARQLPDGNPALLRLLGRLVRAVMNKPTAGWAMRRNLHGPRPERPAGVLQDRPAVLAERHRGSHSAAPPSSAQPKTTTSAPTPASSTTRSPARSATTSSPSAEGAGQHCESGARTLFHQHAFDWLGEVLNPPRRQARGAVPPSCGPPTQHRHSPCTPPRERRNSHVFATPARRHRSPSPALHRRT